MSKNYIKLQNQGNIYQNLMLLNEMANSVGYADENGYFTKRAIAEIAIKGYLLSSEGKVGDDVLAKVTDVETLEELNPVLQNAKQRMQILRALGLISTDYDSELYAITDLGHKVLERVFPTSNTTIPDYSLLLETFMGISTSSEIYEHNVDFNSYIGYAVCYAFSCLDYKISTSEMPLITTYAIEDIKEFVSTVKDYRSRNETIPNTHEHFPKTQSGTPLNPVSNITRTINQILRICGIIEKKNVRIGTENYYVCTDAGKRYVDTIRKFVDKKGSKLWTAQSFRKEKLLRQKELCTIGYNNMLDKGGYSVEMTDKTTVFSPYQLLPETNVDYFLEKEVRQPPKLKEAEAETISSQIAGRDIRLKPTYFTQEDFDSFIKTHISKSNLIAEILSEKEKGTKKDIIIEGLCTRYQTADKTTFYPFVHSLFNAMGVNCLGEIGRFDCLLDYNGVLIPVEIKSFTETPSYNMKGVRQAMENKIMITKDPADTKYAALLIGYNHPKSAVEIQTFIDAVFNQLGIKIIAFDICTLVTMCVNTIWDQQKIDFEKLFSEYGIAEV